MRITFFGPPGSGKGTQADRISSYFGLQHISTGMLFREEIDSGSELGNHIRRQVELGHLVSDEIVNEEVLNRIENVSDFLLDGYPRIDLVLACCLIDQETLSVASDGVTIADPLALVRLKKPRRSGR